jgi:hypothetical protein
MTTAAETMNEATKNMLRDWVRTSANDPERAAKWAQRNMRAVSTSIRFWREKIAEAMA